MKNQLSSSEHNKYSETESVPAALWRTFRSSMILFFLASLSTGIFCWWINKRTLHDFGNALFYTAVLLGIIGWFIMGGSENLVRSQADPLNPMNRAMPGTLSEQTRQIWRDYMEGMTSFVVIGISAALCFGLGWLIVSLVG